MLMQRRFVTLIEMMIVMFLIALITGVVAYNYRGSLDEGKVFKTTTAMEKISTLLNLEIAKNPDLRDNIVSNWTQVVRASPMVQDPKPLLRDAWGEEYQVSVDPESGLVIVESRKLTEYKATHHTLFSD